jgi:hypothetical protein
LKNCLLELAKRLSIHIQDYNLKYNDFIIYTANCIDQDLDINLSIDIERQINIFEELDYRLDFWIQKDLSKSEYSGYIFFESVNKTDCFKHLKNCLLELAKRLSIHIQDYNLKYNDFIIYTANCIDQDLDTFLENIDLVQHSYHLFNEYLENTELSRAIENLDMELGYKCIEETRKAIKKKKKNHLSPNLIQNLLTANNEISFLFSAVQRKHDAHKSNIAKEFFTGNPNYFKIITFDDIKDIEFSSDPNGIRNTRRKIFSDIAKRAGKEIAGYKIAKELAVE